MAILEVNLTVPAGTIVTLRKENVLERFPCVLEISNMLDMRSLKRGKKAPDFAAIGFETLTPVGLLQEKHRLIQAIIARRGREGFSQAELGRRVEISQGRIAQIEAGIAKGPISFDLIFLLLHALGLDIHVILRPRRKPQRVRRT